MRFLHIGLSTIKTMLERTHDFKRLEVWRRSQQMVKAVYVATKTLPDSERFGLTSQIRRSAVSVPSNIAEGCGSGTNKQMIQFCCIARASIFELESQILLAFDLGFIEESKSREIINEISQIQRMINGLISRLRNRQSDI